MYNKNSAALGFGVQLVTKSDLKIGLHKVYDVQ